jgi:hypothetical protein
MKHFLIYVFPSKWKALYLRAIPNFGIPESLNSVRCLIFRNNTFREFNVFPPSGKHLRKCFREFSLQKETRSFQDILFSGVH